MIACLGSGVRLSRMYGTIWQCDVELRNVGVVPLSAQDKVDLSSDGKSRCPLQDEVLQSPDKLTRSITAEAPPKNRLHSP